MSELKKKLSVLKIEKLVSNIKGINDVLLFTDKPAVINWYSGQLDHLDNDIPCICRFSSNIDIKYLSEYIEMLAGGVRHFIIIFWDFLPVYVSLKIESFYDFLKSFYSELHTKDITLFFLNEEKVLDIFLSEYELEVRILDNNAKN